jgi:hypothetical protein
VRIPLQQLCVSANVTAGLNPLVVMSLAYAYRCSTGDVDPILVRRIGRDRYRVTDGRHRFVASLIAGRPDVLAELE